MRHAQSNTTLNELLRLKSPRARLLCAADLFEYVLRESESANQAAPSADDSLRRRLRRNQRSFASASDLIFAADVVDALQHERAATGAPTEDEMDQATQHLLDVVCDRIEHLPYATVRNLTRDKDQPVMLSLIAGAGLFVLIWALVS